MRSWWWMVVAASALQSACAPKMTWNWAPDAMLKVPTPDKVGHRPAAYLLRERRILMVSRWTSPSYTQWLEHDVLAILNEKGFQHTSVRVPYRGDAKILSFTARTVGPDGTIQAVEPSEVHDDVLEQGATDDEDTKVRIFTFPNVKVGSILEHQVTIEGPQIYGTIREFTTTDLPVMKYVLEIMGSKDIIWSSKAYNTDQQWQKTEDGDGWKLSWVMENVPARLAKGDFLTSRYAREPWWVWSVRKFSRKGIVVDVTTTWNTTYRHRADKLYFENGDWYAGFAPDVDYQACTGPDGKRCRISRALAWLRQKAPFGGFDDSERKAADVMAKGKANPEEKARLLYRLLEKAGITANFALMSRRHTGFDDPDFPQGAAFNHMALFVPAQDGIAEGLWVDPSCEHCTVGQIPEYSKGANALLLHATKALNDTYAQLKTERVKVTGADPVAPRVVRSMAAQIAPDGSVKAHLVLEAEGQSLQDSWRDKRTWTDADYQKNVESLAKDRVSTAKVDGYTKLEIQGDLEKGRRSVDFSAPAYATADGAQLIVPLTLLTPEYGRTFRKKVRKTPVGVARGETLEDRLTLEAPPGYVPTKLPPATTVDSPACETTIEVTSKGPAVEIVRRIRLKAGDHATTGYPAMQAAIRAYAGIRDAAVVFEKK